MKPLKERFPSSSISIQYPAKLIIDGRILMDMFSKWSDPCAHKIGREGVFKKYKLKRFVK